MKEKIKTFSIIIFIGFIILGLVWYFVDEIMDEIWGKVFGLVVVFIIGYIIGQTLAENRQLEEDK